MLEEILPLIQVYTSLSFLGPLPNTITDFWRMVWQEKVATIAMITRTKEGKTEKCLQYWPEGGDCKQYGPFIISLLEQDNFADYTIRLILLVVSSAA